MFKRTLALFYSSFLFPCLGEEDKGDGITRQLHRSMNNEPLHTETKQERRERRLQKKRERMPQHGRSLARTGEDLYGGGFEEVEAAREMSRRS